MLKYKPMPATKPLAGGGSKWWSARKGPVHPAHPPLKPLAHLAKPATKVVPKPGVSKKSTKAMALQYKQLVWIASTIVLALVVVFVVLIALNWGDGLHIFTKGSNSNGGSASSSTGGQLVSPGASSSTPSPSLITLSTTYVFDNTYFLVLAANTNLCLQIPLTLEGNYINSNANATIGACVPLGKNRNQLWFYSATTRLWMNAITGVNFLLVATPIAPNTCNTGMGLEQFSTGADEITSPASAHDGFTYEPSAMTFSTSCLTCLSTTDQATVTLQTCVGDATQQWFFGTPPLSSSSGVAGGGGGGVSSSSSSGIAGGGGGGVSSSSSASPPPNSISTSSSFVFANTYFLVLAANTNLCLQIPLTSGGNYNGGTPNATMGTCLPSGTNKNQQWFYTNTTRLWMNDITGFEFLLVSAPLVPDTCVSGMVLQQFLASGSELTTPANPHSGFTYNAISMTFTTTCGTCIATTDQATVTLQTCTGDATQQWLFGTSQYSASPPPAPVTVLPNLVFWYSAFNLTGANGTSISSWPDYSGNSNAATTPGGASSQPVVATTAMNGGPSALFTQGGTSNVLYTPSVFPVNSAYSLTILALPLSNSTAQYMIGTNNTVVGHNLALVTLTSQLVTASNNATNADSSISITLGVPIIISVVYDNVAGVMSFYIGGHAAGDSTRVRAVMLPNTDPSCQIGNVRTRTGFTGYISEILLFNNTLSLSTLQQYEAMIATMYGLTYPQ